MNLPSYLSEDQAEAITTVLKNIETAQESTLVGPAGSGKSTLTKELVELCGRNCVLAAPTGKAALVLRDKSGRDAVTIHRRLYGGAHFDKVSKRLLFHKPDAPCGVDDLFLVDESSMVGTKIYNDVMAHLPSTARILWVGDREQLPPVKDTWGPRLETPTAALTKVHRQAELSQIIRYATAVREGRGDAWEQSDYDDSDPNLAVYDDVESAIEWLVDAREKNEDATLITYTHKIRERVNYSVRERLGLLSDNDFSKGDKLVVRSNNHALGLMNGEVITVESLGDAIYRGKKMHAVTFEELPDIEILIKPDHIETDAKIFQEWKQEQPRHERDRFLHVHYGQCLTVHSSQGSQWKKVGFIADNAYRRMKREDPEMGRRFLYTAITRAETQLAIFQA